jgi:uncharacterized protein (UPF0548 family)
MSELTYPEVGATAQDRLPSGYRHVRRRVRLGDDEVFAAAATGLMTFAMNRAAGLRPTTSAPRAAVGVTVTSRLGFGPVAIAAPCRIVWTVDEPERAGFGYGTLPGHPEIGEEAFVVARETDGVWFSVVAFSRPGAWYARLGAPVGRWLQDYVTTRYTTAMRRVATA